MTRTVATLPGGSRMTDYVSLGVIAKTFPVAQVHAVLAASSKASIRQRDLPAHVMVYYVIALALFMQSSCGDSAYPQIRFVALVENGTHVLFASQMAGCTTSEIAHSPRRRA